MLEKKIFETIRNTWELDQGHPNRGREKKPIPELHELRAIIETAFLASMKREEERPLSFSIALLPKNFVEKEMARGHRQIVFSFDHCLPLNVESIAKLALAFDPINSALVVEPQNEDKSKFSIWGAIFFGIPRNRFKEIPASDPRFNFSRPDILMVTATSTGSLLITRGNSQIGSLSSGKFSPANPTPFNSRAMGSHIIDAIKGNNGFIEHGNLYWHIYRDSLIYILSEISARGHGGTIIIIPENAVSEYQERYSERYAVAASLQIEKLIGEMFKFERIDQIIFKLNIHQQYTERLDALAQLACVDGALILTSQFELLSFGATLNAQEWKGQVKVGPDGFGGGGDDFDASKLGTRHNSAINFIGACHGTIGFVISQDGPIRGFVRLEDQTVSCWPDCRVSMSV